MEFDQEAHGLALNLLKLEIVLGAYTYLYVDWYAPILGLFHDLSDVLFGHCILFFTLARLGTIHITFLFLWLQTDNLEKQ